MTRARAALLVASALALLTLAPNGHSATTTEGQSRALVFVVDGVSFEELLSVPEIAALARAGGSALLATNERYRDNPAKVFEALASGTTPDPGHRSLLAKALCEDGVNVSGDVPAVPGGSCSAFVGRDLVVESMLTAEQSEAATSAGTRRQVLADVGRRISERISVFRAGPTLIMIVAPTGSGDMSRRGDEVTPIIVARAEPDRLPRPSGAIHALRSDTTRQAGLVANVDVAPTILEFFGVPIPAEMEGRPIELTGDPAPFALHHRHLEQRRIRLPIQLAEVAFVSASGVVAIIVLVVASRRGSISSRGARAMRVLVLCVAALPIPLMLGGLLPRLTYWVVIPFLIVSVMALAVLASRWPGPVGPLTFLGLVGLAVLVLDAAFGWQGARIPLLGGTMFDGARFYGLPNAFLGLLLGSGLFVASALPAFPGFLLLVGAGLFAGFPSLGADVGGTITVFFAAGLWWVLRTRPRVRLREMALVAGVTALGLGIVLLANRYLPGVATHATRFVEGKGEGLSGALREIGDRSAVGFDQLWNAPAAWIPLLGLPVVLAMVVRRPGAISRGLDAAGNAWQQMLVMLTLASVVAFFVNDTGVAAAAPVFLYAMTGMAYPAFVATSRDPAVPRPAPVKSSAGRR